MTEVAIRLTLASIALSTIMGVLVHDSHLDSATITALTSNNKDNNDTASGKLSPDLHTHSENMKVKKSHRTVVSDPRDQLKNRHKKVSPKLSKSGNPVHVQYN